MLKRFLKGLLLSVLVFILVSTSVLAVGNPVSISIGDIFVFSSVSTTGDQLWFMRYDVDYSTVPSEDPSDIFNMAIYDTDGTTLLYTRPVNYIQHNIISIYLTPSQALTTGGAYVVKITGNPAVFGVLIEGVNVRSRTLGSGDYVAGTTLGTVMIQQAEILEADWSITLLTSGSLLNTTGATYFNKAVPGLNNMVPEIYQVTTEYPTVTASSGNHSYEETLRARRGTALNDTYADIAAMFGTSVQWIANLWAGFLAMIIGGIVFSATKRPDWSLIFAAVSLPIEVWLGIVMLSIFIVILFLILFIFGIIFISGYLS